MSSYQGGLPDPRIKSMSPVASALQADFFLPLSHWGSLGYSAWGLKELDTTVTKQ